MSDQMRQLSDIKWQATGVDGHTHHTCGEWMYTSDAPPVEADEYERMKQRAEAAELSLKLIEADNRDLEDAHRRIGELEKAREDEVTDSELAILENVKLRERIKELQEQLGQTSDTNPVQELTQEVDRKTFGHLQDRVKELEAQLSDAIERAEAAEWQDTGFCPRCHADELRQSTDLYDDELNLSVIVYRCGACGAAWAGDPVHWVDLAKQLTAMQWRAEAAEAAIAAVPRQAIDALFRQQFGSYPVWFNEMWTPIADWLGYKPARR